MHRLFGIVVLAIVTSFSTSMPAHAQATDEASCDQFLLSPREVKGKKVGPTSCLMQESELSVDGRTYKRVDVGLDGSVEGYVASALGKLDFTSRTQLAAWAVEHGLARLHRYWPTDGNRKHSLRCLFGRGRLSRNTIRKHKKHA